MDALVAVLGFDTTEQVNTVYNIFKHLSHKHRDEPHLANSDQYKLIIDCAIIESTELGVYCHATSCQCSSTTKTYIRTPMTLHTCKSMPPLNIWQKGWETESLREDNPDMVDIF